MPLKIKIIIIIASILQASAYIGAGVIAMQYINPPVSNNNVTVKNTDKAVVVPVVKSNTITFNSDGGSEIKSVVIPTNTAVTKPADPTKDGYTFAGWQLDGKTYDFNTVIDKDINLKAAWTKVEATPAATTPAVTTPAVAAPVVVAPAAPTYRYTKEQILAKFAELYVFVFEPPTTPRKFLGYSLTGNLQLINCGDSRSDCWNKSGDPKYTFEDTASCGVMTGSDGLIYQGCNQVGLNTVNHEAYFALQSSGTGAYHKCTYNFKTKTISVEDVGNYNGVVCPTAAVFESQFLDVLSQIGVTSTEYLQW